MKKKLPSYVHRPKTTMFVYGPNRPKATTYVHGPKQYKKQNKTKATTCMHGIKTIRATADVHVLKQT